MAAPAYAHPSHSLRLPGAMHSSFSSAIPSTHAYERDQVSLTPAPIGGSGPVAALLRGLPRNATREQVHLMVVWSEEVLDIEVLQESEDRPGSAIITFKTGAGAHQAKNILNGKQNLSVEVLGSAFGMLNMYGSESTTAAPSNSSSATASTASSRQAPQFPGAFSPVGGISPPANGVHVTTELPNPEDSARYQSLFSPQSPIGNHLSERPRISGKSLINNDTADDDETGELLKDPVAYAENGAAISQRRATAPHIPISQLASLSLNTNTATGPSSLPPYGHQGILSAQHSALSPTSLNGAGSVGMHYPLAGHYGRHSNFPPVNPADQNPPCNTLYVGNLPIDTSEEELKAIFSKQRGYKRLCFRTKQNGPMCFVEFEDVTFATKALNELYGQPLHNSVKGGIRLSFSKNPLGVRSGQAAAQTTSGSMATMLATSPNGFSTANGPPPGLSAPPGLSSSRYGAPSNAQAYTPAGFPTSNGSMQSLWNSYTGPNTPGGPNSMSPGSSATYMAPHMLGR